MEKAKTSEQADANASACMEASKDMDIPQQHADEWAEYARIWTSAAEALANQMQDLEDGIK